MAEGEEAVVGVFGIEVVVRPVTVEAAFGRPERVDEIEAAFVKAARDAAFEAGEGVESGGGGKEVGNGRARDGEEAALPGGLRKNPISHSGVHGKAEVRDERDGAGRGVEVADFLLRLIAPGVIGSFEAFEAANEFDGVRRIGAEIFVGAERDEGIVSGAETGVWILVIAAIFLTEIFETRENCGTEIFFGAAGGGPTAGKCAEVNEIECSAVSECLEPCARFFSWDGRIDGLRTGEREDGVVKIRLTGAIARGALFVKLAREKFANERSGIGEQFGSEPRDLQQLKPQTHLAIATASETLAFV